MNGGGHMPQPPNSTMTMMGHRHMIMHMTFFWGRNAEILFHGWPGYDRLGMYFLSLAVVFFFAMFVEWLSHGNIIHEASRHGAVAGLLQSLVYALRVGLAYLVMLAVMSFNAGVFLVAIAGHSVGFFFFGSMAFKKPAPANYGTNTDLPPMSCC
ncbi:copper transporter 6-like [Primulina eburnea]|uniref:copper transporter 6-like n=1 Tax=Primulina eburnea TaxID=1245227 RepID=UPI003C6CB714